jgi:hypothetical protein
VLYVLLLLLLVVAGDHVTFSPSLVARNLLSL